MRAHTTVAIFDDNNSQMLAFFVLYSRGHISLNLDGKSGPCPEWRFHEWFSFAIRCGHIIQVRLCDTEMRTTRTVEFQV
jgi:hypothetical protein